MHKWREKERLEEKSYVQKKLSRAETERLQKKRVKRWEYNRIKQQEHRSRTLANKVDASTNTDTHSEKPDTRRKKLGVKDLQARKRKSKTLIQK